MQLAQTSESIVPVDSYNMHIPYYLPTLEEGGYHTNIINATVCLSANHAEWKSIRSTFYSTGTHVKPLAQATIL